MSIFCRLQNNLRWDRCPGFFPDVTVVRLQLMLTDRRPMLSESGGNPDLALATMKVFRMPAGGLAIGNSFPHNNPVMQASHKSVFPSSLLLLQALPGKAEQAVRILCKGSGKRILNVLYFFAGDAERWEMTFLIAGIIAIAVMDVTRERLIMWFASHLFIYIGMSIALHRYFSHKSFKTSRVFQTVLAVWGSFSLQGGALFWAALHRHHHSHCDESTDLHSPQPLSLRSFYWSHVGWLSQPGILYIWERSRLIEDLVKYKELCFIQRYDQLVCALYVIPWVVFVGIEGYVFGWLLPRITAYHCTALVNSIDHMFGYAREEGTTCKAGN
ncbi:MAG: fatty acid desaturase, partial [Methylococcales bacterium]